MEIGDKREAAGRAYYSCFIFHWFTSVYLSDWIYILAAIGLPTRLSLLF